MLEVKVTLLNGHAELLTLLPPSTVQDLRTKAQQAFGKKYLKLVTAKNRVLVDPDKTLKEVEIEDGECLTALVLQPQLAATSRAFAFLRPDSTVVTWGSANCGGDSSGVRDQLKGVMQIQAANGAFAAILADGSVVTWGDAKYGADSSRVRDLLKGVQQIQASREAFAAILGDGSVVTWGDRHYGGDSAAVRDQLKGVQQIQSNRSGAFAAILADTSSVRDQLKSVQQIHATNGAFAAILEDGCVVTWGDADFGGDIFRVVY